MTEISDKKLLETRAVLRPDEVARILQVNRRTVYRLCDEGILDATKVRGCLRISSASVSRLLP